MASVLLTTAAGTLGSSLGGPLGKAMGGKIGQFLGGYVDNAIFGGSGRHHEGPRLADLSVQTSTYGKMLPIVYGTVRIAGNIIWSRPIRETASTSGGGGGKGGARTTSSSTTYSYSASLAIAICEGPVEEILRVWADAKLLDLSQGTYRFYKGGEDQLPDSFIESFEGAGATPAYRGLAYAVIEDFPLADYGNRIPNFTFEVRKKSTFPDYEGQTAEEMVESIVMIPGSGEFVYDTQVQYKVPGEEAGGGWAQSGAQIPLNVHNHAGIPNALLSLNQLEDTFPNLEWVSVAVNWFADSTDAGTCVIKPGVEFQSNATTTPETWSVGSFTRATARQITMVDGSPRYGGTPDDQSLLRYIAELKDRGYKVLLYPMLLVDADGKPWRGSITGSAAEAADFFTRTNGYNAFIEHYAELTADHVDGFIIGSEMVGLTSVTDSPGSYPAVDELINLAAYVKSTLGPSVTVTYAADWSEYHHTDGGWYNLDPLWASSDIDVVGIDAYFPLADTPQSGYDLQALVDGWTEGEGYDWHYTDLERTVQTSLAPQFAWKNLEWWYENAHINPDSGMTAWTPGMKKIWFTEYGFPSVDGAANQPNVFYDTASAGSAFPHHSKGRVDVRAQRLAITATEAAWHGSDMIERRFLWAWDARPFPYWPDLTGIWADGASWAYGHWVQGKLGISNLASIVRDLCLRAGLEAADIEAASLAQPVEGYAITDLQSVRALIEQLQSGFFFDVVESGETLRFLARGGEVQISIPESDLVPHSEKSARELLLITRMQELELPQRAQVTYLSRTTNYQLATQLSQRAVTQSRELAQLSLPVVMPDQAAKIMADILLFTRWVERTSYAFELPAAYAALEPADVIQVEENGVAHTLRIISTQMGMGRIRVKGVAEDVSAYDFYTRPGAGQGMTGSAALLPSTVMHLLDLPAFPSDSLDAGIVRVAAAGAAANWRGSAVYRSLDGGSNYERWLDVPAPCVIGTAATVLGVGPTAVFDEANSVTIILLNETTLSSATESAVFSGANVALVGDEIIQFCTAMLVEPGKYTLSGLLRGRLGTEWAMASHTAGERFVLLDAALVREVMASSAINLPRSYKPVTLGATLGATAAQDFVYTGVALKPYAPVSLSGERDGFGNLTITWIRRTRGGGPWLDYADVPLNEASEAYEVDLLHGVHVVRTIACSSPSATYSAAEQTSDFGSPQASVSVKVYQLSATVGRGFSATGGM